jgi:hypothetical protein
MKNLFFIIFSLMIFCLTNAPIFAQRGEDREITDFDRIDISGHFDIYLKKGDKAAIRVESREMDLDEISTKVSGSTLRIESTRRNFRDGQKGIIYITFTALRDIDMSGAGNIMSESLITSEDLKVELSGAGNIELEVEVKNLDLDLSGAGNLEVRGKAKVAEISISGAGNFRGFKLAAEEVEVRMSGVGKAQVYATEVLDAEANGVGSVRYRGEPKKVRVRAGLLGSVKPD